MVVKRHILLLVVSLLFCYSNNLLSQQKALDTIAFKKDFEKLLDKYGFEEKFYMINVSSNNQKGGQTAFVINNNYSGDSISDGDNFVVYHDTVDKKLYVYPRKGAWLEPFVATDTLRAKDDFCSIKDRFPNARITAMPVKFIVGANEPLLLNGLATHYPCTEVNPLVITLSMKLNEFYVFGDYLNRNKRYLFLNGESYWFKNQNGNSQ